MFQVTAHGYLFVIHGVLEEVPKSGALRKFNPWPAWRLVYAQVFRQEYMGIMHLIKLVIPANGKRTAVSPVAEAALHQKVVATAMKGMRTSFPHQRFGAVLSMEVQTSGGRLGASQPQQTAKCQDAACNNLRSQGMVSLVCAGSGLRLTGYLICVLCTGASCFYPNAPT